MSNKVPSHQPEVTITGAQLGIKFGHIIPPFDTLILENRLTKLGYNVENINPDFPPATKLGKFRLGIQEDLEVSYNNDKQVLYLRGTNPEKIISGFKALYNSLVDLADPIRLNIIFYEVMISAVVKGSRNPLEIFSKEENKFKKTGAFKKLFGQEVSPLGIRLSPSNTPIDNPNWFEFRIEPFTLQPSMFYLSASINRNEKMNKAIDSLSRFVDLTKNLVRIIED